jgi:2'-hydroxyisoflavone reductase
MNLLILGGTQFLGRHLVELTLQRGHAVTLFNRGRTNPNLFPDVETLIGDRGGNLDALKNRRWDAVIDTCGYSSPKVRATAELLAASVERYVFVSSISAYADFSRRGLDESAPLAHLANGAVENEGDGETYGARKVLCENAVQQNLPGRALIIRPGIIVGPWDPLGRFTYWAWRIAQGGEVLAPAPREALVQIIDVRDLANWMIRLVEQKQIGIYNTTGGNGTLTFEPMLEACRAGTNSNARFAWVDESFLLKADVAPFKDLPLWIPQSEKSYAGHFAVDSRRAFATGLACRPLADTARDTLLWERATNSQSRPGQAGLTIEREAALLAAWNGR